MMRREGVEPRAGVSRSWFLDDVAGWAVEMSDAGMRGSKAE